MKPASKTLDWHPYKSNSLLGFSCLVHKQAVDLEARTNNTMLRERKAALA